MSFQENIPAHTPRPPNAFLCFRSRFIREQKAASQARGSKSGLMQDLSRQAGQIWKRMSDEERRPYFDMASRLRAEHKVAYPDYKYTPSKRGGQRGQSSRRRGQATSADTRPKTEAAEPSFTSDSYHGGSHPMPVLSSPYTPPPVMGELKLFRADSLYLQANISNAAGQSQSLNFSSALDRPDSWGSHPSHFLTPDAHITPRSFSSSSVFESQELAYHNFEQTPRAFEPQPDFGSLCRWDDDFSGPYTSSSTSSSAYHRSY
ncbi:high mobility group box domain-containing protein [Mycena capillaripes]|nr:high mobility group box domain-containing protein [Mycena capillaripes]